MEATLACSPCQQKRINTRIMASALEEKKSPATRQQGWIRLETTRRDPPHLASPCRMETARSMAVRDVLELSIGRRHDPSHT